VVNLTKSTVTGNGQCQFKLTLTMVLMEFSEYGNRNVICTTGA